ncbi:unnamed protein product [Ilex paraguariensis]|uniref:RRM domain-containing protein n=2 Tax=Ilex paraguariensis TaxID=185542 RepID=A0ABC8QY15_9AQUA
MYKVMEEEEYRCFVANLSWSTSARGLKEAFGKFGHLLDAKVFCDSRCFCFFFSFVLP